jgi:hypothetical protein
MCYSVESSLKTTTISLLSIIYLLSSNIPHFQWLGITLIGWCGMQFDELLLWLTNPRKGCTKWNKIITMTLIPFTLIGQPLFSLWGSLYVFPWKTLSMLKKQFMIFYTVLCVAFIYFAQYYNIDKTCAFVTKKGHLDWLPNNSVENNNLFKPVWALLIILPLLLFWNKKYMLIFLLTILPFIGYHYGKYTDPQGSIWCFYTSYTSIIASIALFLKQFNIYHIF